MGFAVVGVREMDLPRKSGGIKMKGTGQVTEGMLYYCCDVTGYIFKNRGGIEMKETERIKAGLLFRPNSMELRDTKHKAHETCRLVNTLDEYDERTPELMRSILGSIGERFYFQTPVQFNYGIHTYIGEDFFANYNFCVLDDADVYIGDNVMIAPNVSLMAASHPLIAHERLGLMLGDDGLPTIAENAEPIRIGNNVWIGCGVTVIGGVTIGNDVVIGAGSVVTHDIPDGVLAAGNPCRVIRKITEADSMKELAREE